MSYIGNSPGVASQRVTTTLTATAGQTQFTTQSGYVLGYVDVYLNGVKLVNGADFEAITGTYVSLFAGALAGDVVELVSYVPRGLTDGYTKSEADAKFLDVGGDSASGSLALAAATLSGALTLSGGTANGVAYLNGSKVVTSGSALTFDGSQYQKLTTTTYSDGGFVNARTSLSGGTFNTYDFMEGTTVTGYLRNYGSIFGTSKDNHLDLWNTQNAPLVFGTNNTERARIDNTGNIAIGKTSASSRLHISGSSGVNGAAVTLDIGAQQHAWYLFDSFTSVFNIGSGSASSAWAWTYSGGEVARLTTAGFGINTTSLAGLKLVAKGVSGYPATSGTTQTGVFRVTGGTGLYNVLDMGVNESTDAAWIQATRANSLGTYDSLLLNPYGGKIGVGTTSPAVELDVRARARFGDGTNHVTLGYWDGFSNRIESVNKPLFLTSYSDSIRFGMSGSENMRITSTGSLSFANTNTYAIIRRNTVNGSNGISIQANTADAVDDTNAGAKIQIGGGVIGDTYEGNIDLIAYGSIADANRNQIRFSNRSGTNTVSERMRINHLGNVGIGTSSPQYRLSLGNTVGRKLAVYDDGVGTGGVASGFGTDMGGSSYELTSWSGSPGGGNGVFTWGQLNTTNAAFSEKMRIDSSGNLLVGASSFSTGGIQKTIVSAGAQSAGFQIQMSGSVASYIYGYTSGGTGFRVETTPSYPKIEMQAGGSSGVQLTSGAASWSSLSDERTKTDLVPIINAIQKVSSLRAVTGRFVKDKPEKSRSFLIAQDFVDVFPQAISTFKEKDGDTEYLGLAYTDTIPLLVAAIKEQQALIQQLQQDVAQLRGATQ